MTASLQPPALRVGYVLKRFPRLSETFILNEILEVERQGVAVEVFSLLRPPAEVRHALVEDVRARVTYLPGGSALAGWTVRTMRPDWRLRKQALPDLLIDEGLDPGSLFPGREVTAACQLHLQAATLAILATGPADRSFACPFRLGRDDRGVAGEPPQRHPLFIHGPCP